VDSAGEGHHGAGTEAAPSRSDDPTGACYAGRKADERPVRFQLGDREYVVGEVLDQWYGPDETFYKVCADDGNLYILRHHTEADEWRLESFRRLR
jgi:hypothetical protein